MAQAKSTLPAKFDEKLAALARKFKATATAVGGGEFISFKGGILSYHDSPVEGNKMNVIMVDGILENAFYPGAYDSNNPTPPVCYAFCPDPDLVDEMKPHPASPEPQHATCKGCPQNEWGSAEKGRGKACKNQMKVAFMAADGLTAKLVPQAEVAMAKIPVTSVQGVAAFIKTCGEIFRKPPFGVSAILGVLPDAKTQFKVTLTPKQEIKDNAMLGALLDKYENVAPTMVRAYPEASEDGGSKKKAVKKGGGKTAGRRKF